MRGKSLSEFGVLQRVGNRGALERQGRHFGRGERFRSPFFVLKKALRWGPFLVKGCVATNEMGLWGVGGGER